MPLIVVTGIPCSGKTTRSLELKDYFKEKLKSNGQNIEIISENDAIIQANYDKNVYFAGKSKSEVKTFIDVILCLWIFYNFGNFCVKNSNVILCQSVSCFSDSKKEKAIRSSIKSDIQRKLDSNDLLIFDGSNYIKGYRYEIYCMTKLYKIPQCTLHCNLPIEQAWLWNNKRPESDQYNREIFELLVSR